MHRAHQTVEAEVNICHYVQVKPQTFPLCSAGQLVTRLASICPANCQLSIIDCRDIPDKISLTRAENALELGLTNNGQIAAVSRQETTLSPSNRHIDIEAIIRNC